MARKIFLAAFACSLLAACTVGPDYQVPMLEMPTQWRANPEAVRTMASLPWWREFRDPQLNFLIATAVRENSDVKVAVARIDEYRALLGISKSALYPQFSVQGTGQETDRKDDGEGSVSRSSSKWDLSGQLSYEIDLWGRIRRQNEADLARLFAQEETMCALILTLTASVAQGYVQLLSLDAQLKVAKGTYVSRREEERMIRDRVRFGMASDIDLQQAIAQTALAREQIPILEKAVTQQENVLSLLLGRNPQAILRGGTFRDLGAPIVGAVLPSELLQRRPDIRQAEQELRASNAEIGVAQAERFPTINLLGLLGIESSRVRSLFSSNSLVSQLGGSLAAPIFAGGALEEKVEAAKARNRQIQEKYVKVVQTALKEVEDALVACKKLREQESAKREIVQTLSRTLDLAKVRYRDGLSSYLEVTNAEDQLFAAQLSLITVKTERLFATVDLYKAIGGGWSRGA